MSMRTILLSGLRKSDELVFSSLLSLLSDNTEEKWKVTNSGMSEIAVVDVDNPNGSSLANSLEKCGRKVIRVTTHSDDHEPGLWLHKPVRSTEILKCIAVLNQPSANSTTQEVGSETEELNTETLRLRRWPNKDILNSYPSTKKLCAILIRRALTFEQAKELTSLNTEELKQFIDLCKKQKCLLSSIQKPQKNVAPKITLKTPATLFSRLRSKLMSK